MFGVISESESTDFSTQRRVGRELSHGIGKRLGIGRGYKNGGSPVLEAFGLSAACGADLGSACGHSPEVGESESFAFN